MNATVAISKLWFRGDKNAPCVFIKKSGDNNQNLFLLVYVEYILIISPTQELCQKAVKALCGL